MPAPETARRDAGTPDEVVGLAAGVPVEGLVDVDDWRTEVARVRRLGGDASGPGEDSFSRGREDVELMREKTPDKGRLLLVAPELVVALLVVRVVLWPLTGSLLGETLRTSPLELVVSVLDGLRNERARDRALVDVVDDIFITFRVGVIANLQWMSCGSVYSQMLSSN